MKQLNVLSCCTELGSEVQAFRDRGHNVTTLGLQGEVDIKMDIRDFHTEEQYDFISMHPPCTQFSFANYRLGKCKDREYDMSVVNACLRVAAECNPTYWIMENPRGCLRTLIGKPAATIRYSDYGFKSMKPTDLWGEFPMFGFRMVPNYAPWRQSMPRSPKRRSIVPYGLSLAICMAIENDILI